MRPLRHGGLEFGGGAREVTLLEGSCANLEVIPAARGRVLIGAIGRRLSRGHVGREQQRHRQPARESTPELHSEISNTSRATGGTVRRDSDESRR